jgi:hypothetical protein
MKFLGRNRWMILIASLVVVVLSGGAMARRVSDFNKSLPEPFVFKREWSRMFSWAGREVTLTDSVRDGLAGMKLRYGDKEVEFPVIRPQVTGFKDLSIYEGELAVLRFAPTHEGQALANEESMVGWRTVIVNRRTAPGWDEETWGQVRIKDWTFEVYELLADGQIARREMQFRDRRDRLPAEVYAREELAKSGKSMPAAGEKLTPIEAIEERSWEWQVALFAVPKGQMNRYRFKTNAVDGSLSVAGMGWTFPAVGFSMLGVMLGVILVMFDKTVRR